MHKEKEEEREKESMTVLKKTLIEVLQHRTPFSMILSPILLTRTKNDETGYTYVLSFLFRPVISEKDGRLWEKKEGGGKNRHKEKEKKGA